MNKRYAHGSRPHAPRLAVFTRSIDQNMHSGSGQHWYGVLNALMKLDHGLDITFVHHKPGSRAFYQLARARGIKELIIGRNPFAASRILNRREFDLVHYHLPTIFTPFHRVRGTRIVTIHGAEPVLLRRYYHPIHVLHDAVIVPLVTRAIDQIVTVSQTTAQYVQTQYPIRSAQAINVIYNGVDAGYRDTGQGPYTINAELKTGKHFFFHVSRFSLRKNPWTLLRGFRRFLVRRRAQGDATDWRLVIAGKGWDNTRVRELVTSLQIAEKVHVAGYVHEHDLAHLYATATAFVFPSLCEGFGMPNAEAMAAGCPVITSDAFAIPEVVGDAALVITPPFNITALSDAMVRLADDAELRDQLARCGRERAQRFNWSHSARALVELYHRLYATDRGTRAMPSAFDLARGAAAIAAFISDAIVTGPFVRRWVAPTLY